MNNIVEPITSVTTIVSHRFEGLSHGVPEWPGFSYVGKPAVITRVTIGHRVTEDGIADPEVHINAYALKKDGMPRTDPMDSRFSLARYGRESALRAELIEEYGADVRAEAERIWKKLYA